MGPLTVTLTVRSSVNPNVRSINRVKGAKWENLKQAAAGMQQVGNFDPHIYGEVTGKRV